MWDVWLRRWMDLLFWWAPRKEETPRRAEQAPRGRAAEPAARPAEPSARPAPSQAAQRPAQAEGGRRAAEPGARPAPKPAPAQPAPAAKSGAPKAAEPAAAQPEKTVAPPVPDDLTVIKGIGPAVQNKLRALGITTFADLAAADPDELMKQLKGAQPLSRGRVRHWTEAARQRART
jgi:predicted flap endonuclease-1-like 5' DNA nuclease